MASVPNRISVFYSYSHKDEELRDELEAHLAALWRSGLISEWHDRKIMPGDNWERQIDQHLDSAQLILFLISADFIDSGYCMDVEVTRAVERQKRGECVIVPIILRPVMWQVIPWLHELQVLPKDALPIIQWSPRDLAYVSVCEGILRVVQSRTFIAARHMPYASRGRKRFFDAAIPARVPVYKPSALLVMVRRNDSNGLTGLVEADFSYGIAGKDVHSKPATLHFPVLDGAPQPLDLVVSVESPEFEPRSQSKTIHVPTKGDSQPYVFFATPQGIGDLVLNVELRLGTEQLSACLLHTEGVATESVHERPLQNATTVDAGEMEQKLFLEQEREAGFDLGGDGEAASWPISEEVPYLTLEQARPADTLLTGSTAAQTGTFSPAEGPSRSSFGWMKYGLAACLVAIAGVFGSYVYLQQARSQAPLAAACSITPTQVHAGEAVTATLSLSLSPKAHVEYKWVGKGVSGSGERVRVDTTGFEPGEYSVNVTATDPSRRRNNTATCTASFMVVGKAER